MTDSPEQPSDEELSELIDDEENTVNAESNEGDGGVEVGIPPAVDDEEDIDSSEEMFSMDDFDSADVVENPIEENITPESVAEQEVAEESVASSDEDVVSQESEPKEEEVPETEEDTLEPPEEEGLPLEDFSGRNLFRSNHHTTSFLVAAATDYCKIGGTPIYIVSGTFSVSTNTPTFEDQDLTRVDSVVTPSLLPLNSDTSMNVGVPVSSRGYFYIDRNKMYPTDGGGFDGADEPVTKIYWEHYWERQ